MKKQACGEDGSFMEAEYKSLQKMLNLPLLPNFFKSIGLVVAFICFLVLFAMKFGFVEALNTKFFIRNLALLALLMAAVSRDKVEDELTMKLRRQSMVIAFIIGAIYTIILPYINFGVKQMLGKEAILSDFSSFDMLFMILPIQLLLYHYLKWFR